MDLGISVLLVIAATCHVAPSGLGHGLEEVDNYQKKCQKALISCYEKSYPHTPASEDAKAKEWLGSLKDCVKNR